MNDGSGRERGGLGEISSVWRVLRKTRDMGRFLAYKRKNIRQNEG
jgi:hypothetical protein